MMIDETAATGESNTIPNAVENNSDATDTVATAEGAPAAEATESPAPKTRATRTRTPRRTAATTTPRTTRTRTTKKAAATEAEASGAADAVADAPAASALGEGAASAPVEVQPTAPAQYAAANGAAPASVDGATPAPAVESAPTGATQPQAELPYDAAPPAPAANTAGEEAAPRPNGVRDVQAQMRDVQAREGQFRDAQPLRGERGLRFRGREGRAELRARGNEPRNFRARPEGRDPRDGRDPRNQNGRDANNYQQQGRQNEGRQFERGQFDRDQRHDGRADHRQDNRQQDNRRPTDFDLTSLEEMNLAELQDIANMFNVQAADTMRKNDLVLRILEAQAEQSGNLFKQGILEILPDGKGFLRTEGYLSSNEDVYISQSQIKRFNLRTGDIVSGQVRAPKEMERYYGLLRVEACNGEPPDINKTRKEFEKLTPIFPDEKFNLETTQDNITARIIDLVSPIGKGQRGLIVAPPKAGKTSLIKNVANSIMANHPDVHLIVLLIDERPEEVTDIARSVKGEVVASTFDEMPENHIRVADMVLEKAKRMVEQKKDVVILLDSITRLSRASNLVVNPSGRTMSGGLDPAAMHKPKRLFGAARNIEEGGSLTILATVLIDTGSRMDEYIFEELKGTGNMDLVLDRNLFDQRIFPAIDINKSGTRRDDLLLSKDDLAATFHLRRTLAALDNDKAITLLIDRLKNTRTNSDFMAIVQKSNRQQSAPAPAPAPATAPTNGAAS